MRPYVAAKVAEGRLRDTWREIVGPAADAETTELRLENHILHVRIRSSILRNELFYQREALGSRNQPPLENPTGQCGHHPVKFIFFLRGGSTILGRYWHYSKKKCIFAR